MDKHVARPVFVVGSPRSGTSILTWALGQHPNILPTEEAPGRGPFAVAVSALFAAGNGRGERSHLSAMGADRDRFHAGFGDTIDRLILLQRPELERRSQAVARSNPTLVRECFAIARDANEPKRRWVDGTPESSFYICGLRRLFPEAQFVHILRDVREVVDSMLGFRDVDGHALVEDAEQAFDYWLRATRACDLARRALGSRIVHRLQYADLLADPERALRGALDFLDEAWAPACLEPLTQRINSSRAGARVPAARMPEAPQVVSAAFELDASLRCARDPVLPDSAACAKFEADYARAVDHARHVDAYHETAKRVLERIEAALGRSGGDNIDDFPRIIAVSRSAKDKALAHSRAAVAACGVAIAVQWTVALAVWWVTQAAAALVALGIASAALAMYAWLRRLGVASVWRRIAGARARPVSKQEAGHDDAVRPGKVRHVQESAQVA